jgi:gentisate 1,2-dioxygenase
MSNVSPLLDLRQFHERPSDVWPVFVVSKSEIGARLDALKSGSAGDDGRREALVVHPSSREPGLGLAPGITVTYGVLLPGEKTTARRRNATSFNLILSGSARARVGVRELELEKWDSWVVPGMQTETLENDGEEPCVYIAYSNAALLRKLEGYYEEFFATVPDAQARGDGHAAGSRARDLAGPPIPIGDDGAMLLPYEHLIDPDHVESNPLHWRWQDVAPHLGLVRSLQRGYTGRPLWCLYNPATGARNGTTASFFATVTSAAPNFVTPVHRHVSAAINLILEGDGWSIVDGKRVDWAAGDIMLSAPGWAPHGHAIGSTGAIIITVQDHPLHIGMESLIWQEELKDGPILTLGAEAGFESNLSEYR